MRNVVIVSRKMNRVYFVVFYMAFVCLASKIICAPAPVSKTPVQSPNTPSPPVTKKCVKTIKVYGDCTDNENIEELQECFQTWSTNFISKKRSTSVCNLPRVFGSRCQEGKGRPQILWYWNSRLKICKAFKYLGCNGNKNQFINKTACIQKCLVPSTKKAGIDRLEYHQLEFDEKAKETNASQALNVVIGSKPGHASINSKMTTNKIKPDICLLKKEVGLCRALIQRFFYNSASQRCESFDYGGCGGNENNFSTLNECNEKCDIESIPIKNKNTCSHKPETGPCGALQVRYYYNPENNACGKFIYSGCGGNENRFLSMNECIDQCNLK